MNKPVFVNTTTTLQAEKELAEKLRELLQGVRWLQNWKIQSKSFDSDMKWDIAVGPGDRTAFVVECKAQLAPSQFLQFAQRRRQSVLDDAVPVLAMPRISERMAELCQAEGWGWFDLAGNCHLEIPGTLLLERIGHEPAPIAKSNEANLGTPESGRVVRALLAPENAGRLWTQRAVVDHFHSLPLPIPSPSLALVNKVVQYLRDQALIETLPQKGFRVTDPAALLQLWTKLYRFGRHIRRRYFTLLRDQPIAQRLLDLEPSAHACLAFCAFSAANLQAPNVRQPRTWLFVAPEFESAVIARLEASPVDTGDNLVVLTPDDLGVFYGLERRSNSLACTNPVQTYVDLRHAGGRGDEAAEAVFLQCLKPRWSGIQR